MTNRTFIVDQIQKENSNKIGNRVFKTTHRQGGEYLKRSCEITQLHDELRRIKKEINVANQERNLHRLAYPYEPR